MTPPRLTLPGDPETVTLRRSTLALLVGLVIALATLFALSLAVLIHITRCR
ncbi:hypothetical protein OpiT1DRAFT_04002 [Opitutaceae bacterium TAV1]|nr:hypothetical protein OpiT1DRAFT_04002 [Opitutaceae bacterium TAV1]